MPVRKRSLPTAALLASLLSGAAYGQQVDTTGVWYHLRHHDVAAARSELQRLEDENPNWVPPKELTDAFSPAKPKAKAKAKRKFAKAKPKTQHAETVPPVKSNTELGWAALNAHDPKRAAAYFAAGPQSEESRYGLILALSQSGEDVSAACGPDGRSPRMEQACGDAFAERALTAYRGEKWDEAIALDARAGSLGVARPGTALLAGWSHYRQGDYQAALKSFDAASGEPDAAAGIAQSLIALGRYDELEQRIAAMPALAAPYGEQVGQLALIRQRPTLAASVGAPGTEGYAAPAVSAGFYDREKSGGNGADRISEQGASLSLQGAIGRDQLSGGLEAGHLGTGGGGAAATLATPWAKWDHQDIDDEYAVTLGSSPIGGTVGAMPALGLAGEKDWQSVIGTAAFKVQPRYDSLLSEAGMRDPVTGAAWGRVMEIGPQIGAVLLATDKLAFSGSLSAATLQGHDVAGNSRASANLSASYSLDIPGFDYLRVGPFYGYDSYDKNENFFTPGLGGYYSPQASHSLGAFADFLTTQGKDWLIGGRVGKSWQYARQSGEATQTQLGTDATLRGGVLLGHGVILGGFGRITVSPSGRDKAGGITLTVPLSGRDGLFSADLPHFLDRAWP